MNKEEIINFILSVKEESAVNNFNVLVKEPQKIQMRQICSEDKRSIQEIFVSVVNRVKSFGSLVEEEMGKMMNNASKEALESNNWEEYDKLCCERSFMKIIFSVV